MRNLILAVMLLFGAMFAQVSHAEPGVYDPQYAVGFVDFDCPASPGPLYYPLQEGGLYDLIQGGNIKSYKWIDVDYGDEHFNVCVNVTPPPVNRYMGWTSDNCTGVGRYFPSIGRATLAGMHSIRATGSPYCLPVW